MATKAKGGPLTTTKEKRGTSPSSQSPLKNTIQRGIKSPITPKSPSPSASTSASAAKRTNSTSPSYARNVPNSSKSNPESSIKTPLKPVMSRRSSLDKPLPPKSRVSVISKSQLPCSPTSARANASSSSPSSSSKPLMGRLAKARSFTSEKESRSLRHDVKKIDQNHEAKSLAPKETINVIVEINNNAIIDTHTPEIEEIVEKIEDLDASMISNVNEDPDDIKTEVINVLEDDITEPEIEVEEVKMDESSITIIPPTDKTESFDSIPYEEHESNTCEMEEQSIIPNQEDAIEEEEEVEDEKTELPPQENQELKEKEDKTDQVISHELEMKEREEKIKNGGENGGVKKQVQVVQGKREISVVSNDAIEETATKLREQRVNRVRALAGAFETVISNQ